MKISRREVIVGAAAGAVGITVGTPVLAAVAAEPGDISSHSFIMKNVERSISAMDPPMASELAIMILSLNERLLERHGAELFGDRHMRGPVDEVDGIIIEVKSRKIAARWEFEPAMDDIALGGKEAEEAILNKLVDNVAAEYRHELAANPSVKIYPYVPIWSAGVMIDPESFQPVMSFVTRYATGPWV